MDRQQQVWNHAWWHLHLAVLNAYRLCRRTFVNVNVNVNVHVNVNVNVNGSVNVNVNNLLATYACDWAIMRMTATPPAAHAAASIAP